MTTWVTVDEPKNLKLETLGDILTLLYKPSAMTERNIKAQEELLSEMLRVDGAIMNKGDTKCLK
jgi:hypothetical protein